MERDIGEGHGVTVYVQGAYRRRGILSGLLGSFDLASEVLREVGGSCTVVSAWLAQGKQGLLCTQGEDVPSDEIEAPESLNSSDPIWIGKTLSCGSISGILATSSRPGERVFDGVGGRC